MDYKYVYLLKGAYRYCNSKTEIVLQFYSIQIFKTDKKWCEEQWWLNSKKMIRNMKEDFQMAWMSPSWI